MFCDVIDDVIFVVLFCLLIVFSLVFVGVNILKSSLHYALGCYALDERMILESIERLVLVDRDHIEVTGVVACRVGSLDNRPIFHLTR